MNESDDDKASSTDASSYAEKIPHTLVKTVEKEEKFAAEQRKGLYE